MRRHIHLKRYRQIVNTLAKHGFGFLVDQLGLGDLVSWARRVKAEEKTRLSGGARLRLVMEELGPTFIKLGQVLSTRPDLLPRDVIEELARLQDQVPSFPFEQVQGLVEEELGQPLAELFRSFDREPLAAASIGQVHRAELATGEAVVVKARRPNVERVIRTDLEILFDLGRLAERHTLWGQFYKFSEMAEEFARTLKQELDYTAEGRNADRLRQNFSGDPTVKIPGVYWVFTTDRVLTMEYVEGVKLSDVEELERRGWDRRLIARNLAQAVLKQVLLDGFFHADPHPGNVVVLPGGVVAFLDFGLVGRLSEERKRQFVSLVLGLVRRNSNHIIRAVTEMGIVGQEVEMQAFKRDVDLLRERYYDVPFGQIRLGTAISEILDLAFRYRLRIPTELTLLAKALITLEGVVRELDPGLSIVAIAEPLAHTLLRRRLVPGMLTRTAREWALDYGGLLLDLPRKLDGFLDKLVTGDAILKLEHQNLERAMSHLDRIANRLSFSLVLLAFSIVTAGLVIGSALGADRGRFFFWSMPVLELAFLLATLMVAYLIWAIIRSGRF
ncbi:ABC transporter [Clostridiales bacterium PH28_bin88]|nr:ABC transporter [Clostridiales bacterium PH28_bin88]